METVTFAFVIVGILGLLFSFFFFKRGNWDVKLLRIILVQWIATMFVSVYDFLGFMDRFPELEFSIQLILIILPILALLFLYPRAINK